MFQVPVSLVMLMSKPLISHCTALSLGYPITQWSHHKSAVLSLWVVTLWHSLLLKTNLGTQVEFVDHLTKYGWLFFVSFVGWGTLFCLLSACGWPWCVCYTPSPTHNPALYLARGLTKEKDEDG